MNENERRKTKKDQVSNKYPFKKQMFRLSRMNFQACQVFCEVANKGHVL